MNSAVETACSRPSIADNIAAVREKIAGAAAKSGRSAKDIILVAASKMNDTARVREAISSGIDAVGENRVQELLAKYGEGAYDGAPLHFIGHLQSNKVKDIVGICSLIESVDSFKLTQLIGKHAEAIGVTQEILIEVNIGAEANKSGIDPGQLPELFEQASKVKGVIIRGLMAIPPIIGNNQDNFRYFDRMYQLFIDIREKKYDNGSMCFLSMGMSDTFEEAILAGANMVRVGSAIFGVRN